MTTVKVADIKPGSFFNEDLKIDNKFLVAPAGVALSEQLVKSISDWGFESLVLNGNICNVTVEMPAAKAPPPQEKKPAPAITAEQRKKIQDGFEEVTFDDDSDTPIVVKPSANAAAKPAQSIQSTPRTAPAVSPAAPGQAAQATDASSPASTPGAPATEPLPQTASAAQNESAQQASVAKSALSALSAAKKTTRIKPDVPDNTALKEAIRKASASRGSDETARMEVVKSVYNECSKYINLVYTHYATHKELDYDEICDSVQALCVYIRDNRRYMLRVTPSMEARNKNFLVVHSMRSTVFALVIGLQLHMPLNKLTELGVSCILHEIGMVRLPPQLYISDRQLSATERAQMTTHTIIGYNILKEAGFPLSIQLGTLEHHERETGTGYPRHLVGGKISLYAKIIAVACSFEAISAPRHFRDAHTTYEAMVELLKNENHQYDDTVVKALLYSLSLYPIGAYVYLSNGKIAQVVDVNPANQKNPIVQVVGDTDENGAPLTVQTNDTTLKIIRVMNKSETDDVLKALGKAK